MAGLAIILVAVAMSPPSAAAVEQRVACALPFVQSQPNFFCSDLHQVLYFTQGFDSNTSTIYAELLAVDEQGTVLRSANVHAGDYVRMTSFVNTDFARITQKLNLFSVVAPRPVLHVVAIDGTTKQKMEAYCSNVPWVQVLEPQGAVVNLSDSNVTHVRAAIPNSDPGLLQIVVDGVNVLDAMVPPVANLTQCTPSSPCNGTVLIGGENATISNLYVDIGSIGQYAANTLVFDVSGLGCGGHLFSIASVARPGSVTRFVSPTCHDPKNVTDLGISSVFGVTIDKPTAQQAGLTFPVNVQGEACGGRPIMTFNLNGKSYDSTAGQTPVAPCDDVTTACTYKFPFDLNVDSTDIPQDVTQGNVALGTFDPGSNRAVAAASDDLGNRTFARVIFGTGNTLNPGINATFENIQGGSSKNVLMQALAGRLKKALQDTNRAVIQSTPVPNSFVIGLTPAAVQQQFDQRCLDPTNGVGILFRDKLLEILQPNAPSPHQVATITVDPDCSISCDVPVWVTSVSTDPTTITCPIDFSTPGKIHVTINLPSVTFGVAINKNGANPATDDDAKKCQDGSVVCISRTVVNVTGSITLSGMNASFDITEDGILNSTTPTVVFFKGNAEPPNKPELDNEDDHNTGIECLGEVCAIFEIIFDFITFGLFDLDIIDVQVNTDAFKEAVGGAEPDPIKVKDMKVDEQEVENFNQTLVGTLSSVSITPQGLLAGLTGNFETTLLDLDVLQTPGAFLTGNNLPVLPVTGMKDAAIAISVDALNQMFASMTLGGKLKTNCLETPLKVGDLLKGSCEDMVSESGNAATALLQGVCHGIKLDNCETLIAPDGVPANQVDHLTAIKQGACHGTRGDNCSAIQTAVGKPLIAAEEKLTCNVTPNLNLNKDQPLLICTRQDVPPRLVFPGVGGAAGTIDTSLRMNSLSVVFMVDRLSAGPIMGNIDDVPKCFGPDGSVTGACALYAACLNLNFSFNMAFKNSPSPECGNLPGFVNHFQTIQILLRQAGSVCDGSGVAADDETLLDQAATDQIVTVTLPEQAQNAAPPICMKGFDLGDLVTCNQPTLVAFKGSPAKEAAFQEYVGVTCEIQAKGP